jgi:hypothetical protein
MDQLAIQRIEQFLDVPLVAPAGLHELDAKEIAAVLTSLDEDVAEAREEAEDAWAQDPDKAMEERLEEVTTLLRKAIKNCADLTCSDGRPCPTCAGFQQWLQEAY